MKSKCPFCGVEFDVSVRFEPAINEDEQYILRKIVRAACGEQPYKGYVRPVDGEPWTFEFYLQTYDSPELDIWAKGKARWVPGREFEVLEIKRITY